MASSWATWSLELLVERVVDVLNKIDDWKIIERTSGSPESHLLVPTVGMAHGMLSTALAILEQASLMSAGIDESNRDDSMDE